MLRYFSKFFRWIQVKIASLTTSPIDDRLKDISPERKRTNGKIINYKRPTEGEEKKSPPDKQRKQKRGKSQRVKTKKRRSIFYQTERVDDVPDKVERNRIYIVGENGYDWVAQFVCPCGCGEVIHLNLLKESKPTWRIKENENGIVTVSPSIHRKYGCRSHFFIRNGEIDWR